jgi:hypothetical protein
MGCFPEQIGRIQFGNMEILRDEVAFALDNVDIADEQPFLFLKRLSHALFSMRKITLGYDETKSFAGLLWSVFAGWDIVNPRRNP